MFTITSGASPKAGVNYPSTSTLGIRSAIEARALRLLEDYRTSDRQRHSCPGESPDAERMRGRPASPEPPFAFGCGSPGKAVIRDTTSTSEDRYRGLQRGAKVLIYAALTDLATGPRINRGPFKP